MDSPGYVGPYDQWSENSDMHAIAFAVRMMMGEMATAAVVRVESVQADDGPLGRVDVRPMVSMVDGKGDGTDHGTIYGLPYLRAQGGSSAVILDPAAGDIGLAVFSSRDISTVKTTQAPALPGSARQFDWADGLYLGGFLNPAATQYLRFGGGIEAETPVLSASRTLRAGNGATGSFTTPTGQIVTVQDGIVTNIL